MISSFLHERIDGEQPVFLVGGGLVFNSMGHELLGLTLFGLGDGNSKSAVTLNAEVLVMHLDAEKARFSPIRAPRVPTNPIFLAARFIHAITHNCELVVHEI